MEADEFMAGCGAYTAASSAECAHMHVFVCTRYPFRFNWVKPFKADMQGR